ncbi:MAG: hypothetical protein WDN08_18770 [Rhizomicrobium sp.]
MRAITLGLAAWALISCDALAAAAWNIDTLPDNAPIMAQGGCLMSLGPKGPNSFKTVFLDDGVDVKAVANIKLGGKIFVLNLVSQKTSGRNGAESSGVGTHYDRVFKDKTGAVAATSSLNVTAEHPEADSTEMAGTLSVTYQGTTQKIQVEGGIAC